MRIISRPEPGEAAGEVAEIYAEDIADRGYVPQPHAGYGDQFRGLPRVGEPHRRDRAPHGQAAIRTDHSCGRGGSALEGLAHGRKLLHYISEAKLILIARDYRDAGLAASEIAMMEFAEGISTNSAATTDADSVTDWSASEPAPIANRSRPPCVPKSSSVTARGRAYPRHAAGVCGGLRSPG